MNEEERAKAGCHLYVTSILTNLACELEESAELAQMQVAVSGTPANMSYWANVRNERRELARRLRVEVGNIMEEE